jgi:hypothetical protein
MRPFSSWPDLSPLRAAALGLCLLGATPDPLEAAPIPVRFAEGVSHGFLLLRSIDGVVLATGDLLQVSKGAEVKKRMVFKFKDGSVFEESVVFTEQDVYALQSYHLVQRGPAFTEEIEISLDYASGKYKVQTQGQDGRKKTLEGHVELPTDVYNGMVFTVVKDLPAGAVATVHYLAFTPAPRLIELELSPAGEQEVLVGELSKTAVHYVLKPKLGIWVGLFAKLLGRVPPDEHVWIVPEEVPAFVRFEGPLYPTGPVWRIELASPRWPNEN